MFGQLFRWLWRQLFGVRHEYIELPDGKFLKVRRGDVSIVDEDDVPARVHTPENTETASDSQDELPSPTNQLVEQDRINRLERKTTERVAEEALENKHVKRDVLKNPELIDADSRTEAELKLDIMDGATLDSLADNNPQLTEADVKGQLGFEWIAKAGYNEYGADLAAKINNPGTEVDSTADHASGDSTSEGAGSVGDGIEALGDAGDGTTVTAVATGETSKASGDLAGVETGMSIDTDAGTISTGGEAASSGSGTGSTGSGDAGGTGATGGSGGTGGTGTGGSGS